MSREHMLYDNKKLTSIPVKVTNWNGPFTPEKIFNNSSGPGTIIEGCIVARTRHLIVDGVNKNTKQHYTALHVDASNAWHRRFDVHGKEIEPDKTGAKKVSTGYLMSSYKNVKKEGVDEIPLKDLHTYLKTTELSKLVEEKVSSLRGNHIITIWADEKDIQSSDLFDGANVRLRTKGGGAYLESVIEMDAETAQLSSYSTGEKVGGSWTDKVIGLKGKETISEEKRDTGDAVDDDEWDD